MAGEDQSKRPRSLVDYSKIFESRHGLDGSKIAHGNVRLRSKSEFELGERVFFRLALVRRFRKTWW